MSEEEPCTAPALIKEHGQKTLCRGFCASPGYTCGETEAALDPAPLLLLAAAPSPWVSSGSQKHFFSSGKQLQVP